MLFHCLAIIAAVAVAQVDDPAPYRAHYASIQSLHAELVKAIRETPRDKDLEKWGVAARNWTARWENARVDVRASKNKRCASALSMAHHWLNQWLLHYATEGDHTKAHRDAREYEKEMGDALLLIVAMEAARPREFVDKSGKFRVTATFISMDDNIVVLRKSSGETIRVPLARFSTADAAWLEIAGKAVAIEQ